jgi:hypothetical protein
MKHDMQLRINNQPRRFVPLPNFRQQWALLDDFTIDRFDPKNWAGLGSVETAGPALIELRQKVI